MSEPPREAPRLDDDASPTSLADAIWHRSL
jgi:hypothetical protein